MTAVVVRAEPTRLTRMLRPATAPARTAAREPAPDVVEMPYPALLRLLGGAPAVPADRPRLTARQTAVLTLMAEGHGNAVIARTLNCSEHTVKNVLYDLMSRLHARNRSHAVACAVQHSLI